MKNVIEHIANGSTTYHVTLHGVKSSMIVSASPAGNLSVFKKIKNKLYPLLTFCVKYVSLKYLNLKQ